MDPTFNAHTDAVRHVTFVSISGPLTDDEHQEMARAVCDASAPSYGLVVNLSAVTVVSDIGLAGLADIARLCQRRGQRLAFVCSELLLRSELVLADLDTLAPLLHAEEQALPMVAFAA